VAQNALPFYFFENSVLRVSWTVSSSDDKFSQASVYQKLLNSVDCCLSYPKIKR